MASQLVPWNEALMISTFQNRIPELITGWVGALLKNGVTCMRLLGNKAPAHALETNFRKTYNPLPKLSIKTRCVGQQTKKQGQPRLGNFDPLSLIGKPSSHSC